MPIHLLDYFIRAIPTSETFKYLILIKFIIFHINFSIQSLSYQDPNLNSPF